MSAYQLTWITDHLAVGHAPMSYDELESIQQQGINAVVNLCGEYCDLHQIERDYGFEVFYLPVQDDRAPKLEDMELALEWLDEAIYLGKKVLVHCRLGIGRTGTFVTSYLIRRGFGLKPAQRTLKKIRSSPTSFSQWRLLRKYRKQAGELTIREPSLEGTQLIDLSPYFGEYEALGQAADEAFQRAASRMPGLLSCGRDTDGCCSRFLNLQLIEAAYLNQHLNKRLSREERLAAIQRAVDAGRELLCEPAPDPGEVIPVVRPMDEAHDACRDPGEEPTGYLCPLNVDGKCTAYSHRPITCRLYGMPVIYEGRTLLWGRQDVLGAVQVPPFSLDKTNGTLYEISRRLFFAQNGTFLEGRSLVFPITNVVSGKFVQDYFAVLMQMDRPGR